jgi:acyl-CoA thioesterase
MRESENDEAPRSCINHVAAMSWAETTVPDNTLASHKRQNIWFRSANQVEADFISSQAA